MEFLLVSLKILKNKREYFDPLDRLPVFMHFAINLNSMTKTIKAAQKSYLMGCCQKIRFNQGWD